VKNRLKFEDWRLKDKSKIINLKSKKILKGERRKVWREKG
jgi:hypothetical protein